MAGLNVNLYHYLIIMRDNEKERLMSQEDRFPAFFARAVIEEHNHHLFIWVESYSIPEGITYLAQVIVNLSLKTVAKSRYSRATPDNPYDDAYAKRLVA